MRTLTSSSSGGECRNPSLGFTTKAWVCKGVGQKWSLRITFHAFGSVGKCEEWTHTLPSGLPLWELESRWTHESLEGDYKGQITLDWKVPYTIKKFLEFRCLKMGLHDPFGYLKHKLWPESTST
jgi:hypothetical protein